ncbi:MAG TPA: tyrosine-type recombinase/integrase [Spirochaetota bacterium]|nr:tyrosine-type recombinase/integrase [Spirochaetota bacterium]
MLDQGYKDYLVLKGFSPQTIETRYTAWTIFKRFLNLYRIGDDPAYWTAKVFTDFHTYLKDYRYTIADNSETGYRRDHTRRKYVKRSLSNDTVMIYMRAMRHYMKYLYETRAVSFYPFETITLRSKNRERIKDDISEKDINRIVSVINESDSYGFRDKTMIELIYGTGIRKSETAGLNITDLNMEDRYLIVFGKGRKQRIVPLGQVALRYLREYIYNVRLKMLNPDNMSEKALFLSKGGRRLTPGSIGRIIRECGRAAGVKGVYAHKLRHAFALHMLRRGCDIRYIQEILGHERLATTTVYTQIYDYDLAARIAKFHPGND